MKYQLKSLIYIYAYLFLAITLDTISCKPSENKFVSLVDDDEIATITTDSESDFLEAIDLLSEKGGTIYIDTPVITMSTTSTITISGIYSGGIIGIRQSNGEYPRINFIKTSRRDLFSGVTIYGSNKFIEYMIVENSLRYGVSIIGSNNILDHVISRYNHGSGFYIYGDFNNLNYCYSYRNCDANTFSISSDGFLILGETHNVFNYCFAWDNLNSGFNYARIFNSSDLSYLHSGSWNNGNINVFTGRYDYDNGNPLDKNLWTIQDIIESDPNFVTNYYNKQFDVENAKILNFSVNEWISYINPRIDGHGFIFGNRNSSQSIDVKRNSLYNVAFDQKSGGFVDLYNHRYNALFTYCVAFNNDFNYRFLYYTFSRWTNIWSWDSKNKDQLNGNPTTKKPRNTNSAERSFYSVRDQIVKAVTANMFPDGINFDNTISSLRE